MSRQRSSTPGTLCAVIVGVLCVFAAGCRDRPASAPSPNTASAAPTPAPSASPDASTAPDPLKTAPGERAATPSAEDPAGDPDAAAAAPPPPKPARDEGTGEQLLALDEGKSALEAGRLDAAAAAFRRAWAGPPTGAAISAGLVLAELAEAQGKTREADRIYRTLVEKAPEMPEIQFTAGRFAWRQRDAALAIDRLRAAIEVEPDFLPAYIQLGTVLTTADRGAEAAPVFLEYERRLNVLLRTLKDERARLGDRVEIVELLGALTDERVLQHLIDAMAARPPEVRAVAAQVIAEDDAPAALEALAKAALAEKHPAVRVAMTAALRSARARAHENR
jgi:tetratricopeptide (TPR) repeat protein